MLQFAALPDAAHEGLTVDRSDRFQHSCHGLCQRAEGLFRRREQALQFRDGGRSLLALDAGRLIAAHGVSSNPAGFLLDCRRERANGERLAFRLGLDEQRPFEGECLADSGAGCSTIA